jgi:hypothetical protein
LDSRDLGSVPGRVCHPKRHVSSLRTRLG